MKKLRKNTQLSLLNPKRAGRPSTKDIGIRHTKRLVFNLPSAFHITIKVRDNKADIKNKRILQSLHHAIKRARLQGVRVLHFTLEYNHVHLVIESSNHKELHKGMQAFGISLAKKINKLKNLKGTVYKNRYHQKLLKSRSEFKNAVQYVFGNGVKHKRASSKLDPFNSLVFERLIPADIQKTIDNSIFLRRMREDLRMILNFPGVYYMDKSFLWR